MASNGENLPTFPCGTIFRATHQDGSRRTALVADDGTIRILRIDNYTPKSPEWRFNRSVMDGKTVDEFIEGFSSLMPGWTLTADVRPPKDWWTEAGTTWRSLPPGTPRDEVARITQDAFAKAREGWAEYVRRLMARYPVFTEMVEAPNGTNVPWRLQSAEPAVMPPAVAPQPQMPALLMPAPASATPAVTPQPVQSTVLETIARILAQPTITLTRQQLNIIVTCISGKSITDDQWTVFHSQFAS